jgi:hypothetical protein
VHDICRAASTHCGDGFCDTGESCTDDNSACSSGYACTNGCVSSGGSSSSGGGGGGSTTTTTTNVTCTESWICLSWSECSEQGTQIRSCVDSNSCGTTTNKPEESQSCTYEPSVEEPVIEEPAPPVVEEQPDAAIAAMLADMVIQMRTDGISDDQIRQTLESQGYNPSRIDDAIRQADAMGVPEVSVEEEIVPLEAGILLLIIGLCILILVIILKRHKIFSLGI